MKAFEIHKDDWSDLAIIDMKAKAENIMSSFVIIRNTIASIACPETSNQVSENEKNLYLYMVGICDCENRIKNKEQWRRLSNQLKLAADNVSFHRQAKM